MNELQRGGALVVQFRSVPDPKWQERPLAVVALMPDREVGGDEPRAFRPRRFARWPLPDDVVFVPELPHTSTGKLLNFELRSRFKDWNRAVICDDPVVA